MGLKAGTTGLVLAGGRGTRMNRDKAGLIYGGEPLAQRAVRTLRDVCVEVLVASGDGSRLDWLGAPQVADAAPDAGPLAGIVAGLEAAATELVAVLAVDMPFASASVFRLLLDLRNEEDAVVPRTDRGPEPLHSVYAASAAKPLRTALEAGERAVHRALESVSVRFVGEPEWRPADPTGRFAFNVNVPEDLAGPES